jgi:DNA-binding MarR family transcriptional regulator
LVDLFSGQRSFTLSDPRRKPRTKRFAGGGLRHGLAEGSAEEAMCVLMSTSKLVQRFAQGRISAEDLPAKMSGPRMGVLFAVHEAGGLRMGDLAARLGVKARTVTDLVDGLERDGLLVRKADPLDRRAILLELPARAATHFAKMRDVHRSFVREIFSTLKPAERKSLIQLLDKLQRGPIGKMAEELWQDAGK